MEEIEKAKQVIRQAEMEVQKRQITKGVGEIIVKELKPALEGLVAQMRESVAQYLEGIKNIKIEAPSVSVSTPEVTVPKIDTPVIPKIELPTINVPEIKVPEIVIDTKPLEVALVKAISKIKIPAPEVTVKTPKIDMPKMPEFTYPKSMSVGLENITRDSPMPVILVDDKGKYVKQITDISVSGGGGGGGATQTFNGMSVPAYDYVAVTYPSTTTEKFTLKLGGSGGSTVCTLLLTYSDATKASLTFVEKQ